MAKILTVEIDTVQLRVAEVDSRGQHIYHCFVLPVPQGAVDDGQIRDTKSLGKLLKAELSARGIKTKKVFFAAGSSRIASREVRIPFVKKDRIQSIIQENAKLLDIPLTTFETQIFDSVAEVDKNPCYLCARMRRGYLYSKAKELGCNKIALGHHFDDVIETILMGMLYSGKVETMMPKLHSQNFEGMELIRPLYLVKEEDIKAWRDYNRLQFIQCACRFTENCTSCGGAKGSKREEMKDLVTELRKKSEFIDSNIFNSVSNVNLKTIIGYKKDGEYHNFLDNYDAE